MDFEKNLTFGVMLGEVADTFPDKDAILSGGKRITYRKLRDMVDGFARGLLKIGVGKGDHVALWMPNIAEWIIAKFAVAGIGAVLVPLNTRYKAHEMEYVLKQSDSSTLILSEKFEKISLLDILTGICPELADASPGNLKAKDFSLLKNIIVMGNRIPGGAYDFEALLRTEKSSRLDDLLRRRRESILPEDVVNIIYTSGTTSFPKGVMLCHGPILKNYRYSGAHFGLKSEDRLLLVLPFCHIAGGLGGVLAGILHGATLILMPRFDPDGALRMIEENRVTVLQGVTKMFYDLLGVQKKKRYDLSTLEKGSIFPGPYTVDFLNDIMKTLNIKRLRNGYGLTESTNGLFWATTGEDPIETIASALGKFTREDVEMKIADPATGKPLGAGQTGEYCLRGYLVMKGYYKNPKETAAAIDANGWLHTGDLCELGQDGYIRFRGRLKDMIKTSGFNVSCEELEHFLREHPKIKEVSVIGIPDPVLNETITACVQLNDGESCEPSEIIDFCKGKIANYKIPKHVKFVDDFPMSTSSKVQKFKLREQVTKVM
jgi:fatty-acyl-CoA synthase